MKAACLLSLLLSMGSFAAEPSKSGTGWRISLPAALEAAKEAGKPVLVDVWADWCGPCKRMDREVWSDARIIEASKKFVCVAVDRSRYSPDEITNLGAYRIRRLPSVAVLDPWGEVVVLTESFITATELAAILREMPADYNSVRSWREALDSDRNNSRALLQVGQLYQSVPSYGVANRYYREALTKGGARENEAMREALMLVIAMNELRRTDWRAARRALKEFETAFPQSARMDQALFGYILADVRQKKLDSARKRTEELASRFPNSTSLPAARDLRQQLKPAK